MSDASRDETKEEILIAISISFGSLFIATVLTLIIAKYYKKIRACCLECMPCIGASGDECRVEDVSQQASQTDKVPLMLKGNEDQPFIIPGTFCNETVQPDLIELSEADLRELFSDEIKAAQDNSNDQLPFKKLYRSQSSFSPEDLRHHYPLSRFSSVHTVNSYETDLNPFTKRRNALYKSEPVLSLDADPSLQHDNIHTRRAQSSSAPHSHIKTIVESPEGSIASSEEDIFIQRQASALDVRPELYDKSRKKSVGVGTLGKIKVSLQFLDQERSKLELLLNNIDSLKVNRHGMTAVYIGIMLLPDRENMYRSRNHSITTSPSFEQAFVFTRAQSSETFETKTLRLLICLKADNGRQETFGESRLQLVGTEIYSKVPTNFVLNIRPPSQLTEIGDILLEMVFTDDEELFVVVKTLKLASKTSVENFLALQVKCVVRKKKRKLGPSSFAVCPVPERFQSYVPVNIELKQKIKKGSFADCALHIVVAAKHRIMGKKLTIGKVVIGNGALDQSEVINWKNVMTQIGIPLNLWHVVYA